MINKIIKKLSQPFRDYIFLHKNAVANNIPTSLLRTHTDQVVIISVAYNNEMLLEHQIRLLNKNILDSFVFVVADNSSNVVKRKLIKSICEKYSVAYISLPQNPYATSSNSHGIALNWLYRHVILKINPKYWGFIDHDIFPIVSHSLIATLKEQPVYGHLQTRGSYWYLWAGFSFFTLELVRNVNLNFMPVKVSNIMLDTGGGNWKSLFSALEKKRLKFPSHSYQVLGEGAISCVQSSQIEIIGEWAHSFNGSYWLDAPPKENALNDFLSNFY
jgi:hypothetical protein